MWTAAAIYGQAVMSADEADKLVELLGLSTPVSAALQRFPMSAIDFDMDINRVPDLKGDRVAITMTGKFLPYKKW